MSAAQPAAVLLDVREWLGFVPSLRLAGSEIRIDRRRHGALPGGRPWRPFARPTTRRRLSCTLRHGRSGVSRCWPTRQERGARRRRVVPDAVAVAAAGPTDGDVLVIDVGSFLTVSVVDAASDPPRILWSRISLGAGGEAIAHAIRAVTHVPGHSCTGPRAVPSRQEHSLDWTAIRRQIDPAPLPPAPNQRGPAPFRSRRRRHHPRVPRRRLVHGAVRTRGAEERFSANGWTRCRVRRAGVERGLRRPSPEPAGPGGDLAQRLAVDRQRATRSQGRSVGRDLA